MREGQRKEEEGESEADSTISAEPNRGPNSQPSDHDLSSELKSRVSIISFYKFDNPYMIDDSLCNDSTNVFTKCLPGGQPRGPSGE